MDESPSIERLPAGRAAAAPSFLVVLRVPFSRSRSPFLARSRPFTRAPSCSSGPAGAAADFLRVFAIRFRIDRASDVGPAPCGMCEIYNADSSIAKK